jgi:serine protease
MAGYSVVRVVVKVLSLLLVFSAKANAARMLVYFEDQATHQKLQSDLFLSSKPSVLVALAATPDTQIKASLQHVGAWVVESNSSAAELKANLPAGIVIEEERFRPSPKPVHGFQLTPAWAWYVNGVKTVFNSDSEQLELLTAPGRPFGIDMVKSEEAWALSNQGEGAKVAILDTGIDKDHPALKPNIKAGKDFVGDNNGPYPYADKEGHGTHVAGTIAAVEYPSGFIGVAPDADLYIGRVCGQDGCSNVSLAQGLEWAISQKVDVISMSLGGNWISESEKRAIAAAESAGVVIVAASGNDGTGQVSYPAAVETVVAVGAIDKTKAKADFSQYGPELDVVAPGVDTISSVPQGSGREANTKVSIDGDEFVEVASLPFLGTKDQGRAVQGKLVYCQFGKPGQFPSAVRGKYALISRGEIPFMAKVKNALQQCAVGIVFFNNQPGLVQGAASNGAPVNIPVVMVEQQTGEGLRDALENELEVVVNIQTVAADFANFSGTSMATPHVSGVVALMRAAHPGLAPARVRQILKSTAEALGPNPKNQFGSGLVDAEKAVTEASGR